MRLGEAQQVIQKDAPLRRQQPATNCGVGGNPTGWGVTAAGDAEQALYDRANGVTPFANSEVQHEPPVYLEAFSRRDTHKFFCQPSFADTRVTANHDSAAASALKACFQNPCKLSELSLAAYEGNAPTRSVGDALRLHLPDSDRCVDSLDFDLSKALTINIAADRTIKSIRYQRFAGAGCGLQACGQIHGIAGYRILPMLVAAGTAGHHLTACKTDMNLQPATSVVVQLTDLTVNF